MKFAFTDDQQVFAETLSEVFAKRCPPEVVRACWDSPTGYSEELWATLAEMGVLAVTATETAGGLGGDERDLVQLIEAAGKAAAPLPLLEHVAVGVPALAEAAVSSQTAEGWLEKAITGEILVTAGISDTFSDAGNFSVSADETSGSSSASAHSTADEPTSSENASGKGADDISPTSSKGSNTHYANYAAQADVAILSHEGELYAVERKDYQAHEQPSVDGTRRIARVEWSPDSATLLPGASASLAFDRGATAAAASCVGLAQHMLDTTVEYVKEREQFGKPVGSYQAVKHHLADVAKAVSFARPSVYAAAWAVSQNSVSQSADSENTASESATSATTASASTVSASTVSENAASTNSDSGHKADRAQYVSAAKSLASDAADLAAAKCLQCHGAIGYTFEHDLQLWLKRAWTTSVSWGSAPYHRSRLATLLKL